LRIVPLFELNRPVAGKVESSDSGPKGANESQRLAGIAKATPFVPAETPPASCLTVRVGSPDVASVPGARLHSIGMSLHETLVSGTFRGCPILHLPIPGCGSSCGSGGRVCNLVDRPGRGGT
jgi:hypothetical protein